jgi:hypothetical protein
MRKKKMGSDKGNEYVINAGVIALDERLFH